MEKTLIIVKPDACDKHKDSIMKIFAENGFKEVTSWTGTVSSEFATKHYAEHKEKSFFKDMVAFISSGNVHAVVLEKENAVIDARKLIGATDPKKAHPGSIRELFGQSIDNNAIHGSDSVQSALREIKLWFPNL